MLKPEPANTGIDDHADELTAAAGMPQSEPTHASETLNDDQTGAMRGVSTPTFSMQVLCLPTAENAQCSAQDAHVVFHTAVLLHRPEAWLARPA